MFLTNIKCDEIAMMNIFILTQKTLYLKKRSFFDQFFEELFGYKNLTSKVQCCNNPMVYSRIHTLFILW